MICSGSVFFDLWLLCVGWFAVFGFGCRYGCCARLVLVVWLCQRLRLWCAASLQVAWVVCCFVLPVVVSDCLFWFGLGGLRCGLLLLWVCVGGFAL